MSLWGPLLAKYLVDGQMKVIESLIAGDGSPVWSEESPALSVGKPFGAARALRPASTRRAVTGTLPTGARARRDAAGRVGRRRSVARRAARVGAGRRRRRLRRCAVAERLGRGRARQQPLHMLTHYAPVPEPNGKLLAERQQKWYVDWQVPADMPAGTYRLRITGTAYDGQTEAYALAGTAAFEVELRRRARADGGARGRRSDDRRRAPAAGLRPDGDVADRGLPPARPRGRGRRPGPRARAADAVVRRGTGSPSATPTRCRTCPASATCSTSRPRGLTRRGCRRACTCRRTSSRRSSRSRSSRLSWGAPNAVCARAAAGL